MINNNTFKNVTRVTEDYDGTWAGRGWYAYHIAINRYGRYEEHTAIDYLRHEDEMDEEYVDYIGDYAYAIAEVEGVTHDVLSIYLTDDEGAVEDRLTEEYYADMSAEDPYLTEDDTREFVRLCMAQIDENGYLGHSLVECERYDVTFL